MKAKIIIAVIVGIAFGLWLGPDYVKGLEDQAFLSSQS